VSAEQSKDSNTRIVGTAVEDARDATRAGRPRVLVVDDHAGIRHRVVGALMGTCEIVGTVEDGASALSAYESLKPAVIVLDFSMADMNGVEVTKRIRQHDTTVRIVIYSSYDDPELKAAATEAGANAYIAKARLADLVAAIQDGA
jgi:DNA-binding NarL/FixJ family response regulator